MIACPSCSRENPEGARFCAFCGTPLEAAAPVREERKVVSVVFVDLVGHTARSESADPEDVRALLAPYHAKARRELERFGGTVEKFIGDAVMAVFGAPSAHEDDAERAVRAALAVRDAFVEEHLDVRIAVNTGEALVTLGARPEAGEAMVAGDVVNTAARLQAAAPVNGILVGATTRLATARAIDYDPVPSIDAKGKSERIAAWLVLGSRARQGVDLAQHAGIAFVGRDAERRLLIDAADRAARDRTLQLVTLVGAPGMGKSRLVWELFRELDSRRGIVASWRQGRAYAYGGGSFGAVAEVVRAEAGILDTDDGAATVARLEAALDALPTDDSERAWLGRRLAPLVHIGDQEDDAREEAFAAWRRFLELVADRLPLVLVLEDLHWADDGTLDFVEYLADWSTDSPVVVLCTARPELLERRPAWGGGRLNSQTLSLGPLDDDATAAVLAGVLGPVVDADTQKALLAQAGGNPLYAEEFARLVAETGSTTEVPPTVQGVIAARLDVLALEEKALLQGASVLGKVFWRGGVEALGGPVSDETLLALTRKELLRRALTSSVRGEMEFAFRHALVRDVAYASVPRSARAEKHRLAAEWIAATATARPDLVAHHYLEAIALSEAAGLPVDALRAPAREALVAAGDRATALGAADDALTLFRRALDLGDEDPEIYLRLAGAASTTESGTAYAERARLMFEARGDVGGMARAEVELSSARWQDGDVAGAREASVRAIELARSAGAKDVLAGALEEEARILMTSGLYAEAIEPGVQAVALAEELGLTRIELDARVTVETSRAAIDPNDTMEALLEAGRRAEGLPAPVTVVRAYSNYGFVLWLRAEIGRLPEVNGRLRDLTERFPLPRLVAWVNGNAAMGYYSRGDWGECEACIARYDEARRAQAFYLDLHVEVPRCLVRFARDDAEAVQRLEQAIEGQGGTQADAMALALLAVVYGLLGRAEDADATAARVQSLPEEALTSSTMTSALVFAQLVTGSDLTSSLGGDASPWGRVRGAFSEALYADGIEALDSIGARGDAAFARLLCASRDREHAAAWIDEATAFYERVGATRYLRMLDELRAMPRSA